MSEREELKVCPFCGKMPEDIGDDVIYCNECLFGLDTANWNIRTRPLEAVKIVWPKEREWLGDMGQEVTKEEVVGWNACLRKFKRLNPQIKGD